MTLIADALLIAGALAAAFYCWILSARVKSLKDLDNGLGAAIAALSIKVDEMQSALRVTQKAADASRTGIDEMTSRAEKAAEDLTEILDRVEAAERRERSRIARKASSTRRDARRAEPEPEPEPQLEVSPREVSFERAPARRTKDPEPAPQEVEVEAEPEAPAQAQSPSQSNGVVQPLPRRRAAPAVLSNAEKLQREIRDRLAARDQPNPGGSDDVVKTIQSLLVAARQ